MQYMDREFRRSIRDEIVADNMRNMEGEELARWAKNAFREWRDRCIIPADWDYWYEDGIE